MKIVLLSLIFATFAFADESKKQENLAKVKEDMVANFDKRIAALQEAKTCVQNSTENDKLKSCHKAMREKMESLHQERKGKRMEFREGRKERRKERNNKKKD